MILRTVLAVVLGAALLAAATPAIEYARADRTDAQLRDSVTSIERALDSLSDDETTPESVDGARRTVTVTIPERSWTTTDVEYVRIETAPGDGSTTTDRSSAFRTSVDGLSVHYRIGDRSEQTVRVTAPVRVDTADGAPIRLTSSGSHALVLQLEQFEGESTVVVEHRSDD